MGDDGRRDDDTTRDDPGKDLEVEIADLSRSGQVKRSRLVELAGPPTGRRFWRLATAVGVILLAALIIALASYGSQALQALLPKPPPPLTLRPQTQGMTCLLDAAWSPQGTRIALLGRQSDIICPIYRLGRQAGQVMVYDASSGKLLTSLHPDAVLVSAIQTFSHGVAPTGAPPSADTIMPAIMYQHVLWSPDGKRLALTFSFDPSAIELNLYLPDGEPEDLYGVLLLDANGAHPRVILQLESAYASFAFQFKWDLQAGAIVAAPAPPYPTNAFGMLLPALAYHWQPDGSLAPDTPLSVNAPPPVPPLAPVGNPDGGRSFTIWQPGFVQGVSQLGPNGLMHLPGVYTWSTIVEAWSPDGHYLLDAIEPDGLLELPDNLRPTQDELKGYGVYQQWLLPVRDPGLLRILSTVNPNDQAGMAVSWRPDGRTVATLAPETQPGPGPISIYDCVSGRQRAVLQPPMGTGASLWGQATMLRWSPDGSRLLAFSQRTGGVVVWGPDQLPP